MQTTGFKESIGLNEKRMMRLELNRRPAMRTIATVNDLDQMIAAKSAICCVVEGEAVVIPWHSISSITIEGRVD